MTPLSERLAELSGKAVQTDDDIRYYSGGSKHNQAAVDLAIELVNAILVTDTSVLVNFL